MEGHIEDRVVRGMARLGVARHLPYSVTVMGTSSQDIVDQACTSIPLPSSVKVLMSPDAKLPEADYPFKLKNEVDISNIRASGASSRVRADAAPSNGGAGAVGSSNG